MDYLASIFLSSTNLAMLAINIILAWSLFVPLSTGQVSLGQAGFMALGAYSAAIATVKFNFPLPVAIVICMTCGALLGLIVGFPALRIRGIYLALVALGVNFVLLIVFINWEYVGGPLGMACPHLITLPVLWVIALSCGLFMWLMERSPFGRACRAVQQDDIAAAHFGINITYIKVTAFVIGAALAALSGGLYAYFVGYIVPSKFDAHLSLMVLLWVTLGGERTFWGSIIGVIVFIFVPELFKFAEEFKTIIFPIIVLGMIIIRPQGIISLKTLGHLGKRLIIMRKRLGALIGIR